MIFVIGIVLLVIGVLGVQNLGDPRAHVVNSVDKFFINVGMLGLLLILFATARWLWGMA